MAIVTRRNFLLSTAALSVGCVERGPVWNAPTGADARIRTPALGQSWTYAKHDLVTGIMVDTEVDRISAVVRTVAIESHSGTTEDAPVVYPSWGPRWSRKYSDHTRFAGRLPGEVQDPWGMVLVDPHWTQLQVYEKPIPLWPTQLRPGWSTTVSTRYMIPDSQQMMPWQLTMHARKWESIEVPAGHFTALRYTNLIDFRYTNVSERVAGQRKENIWFVPEIGRWVVRESSETFYQDVGEEFNESSYRWELLSWT